MTKTETTKIFNNLLNTKGFTLLEISLMMAQDGHDLALIKKLYDKEIKKSK